MPSAASLEVVPAATSLIVKPTASPNRGELTNVLAQRGVEESCRLPKVHKFVLSCVDSHWADSPPAVEGRIPGAGAFVRLNCPSSHRALIDSQVIHTCR